MTWLVIQKDEELQMIQGGSEVPLGWTAVVETVNSKYLDELAETISAEKAASEQLLASKMEALWAACNSYTSNYISGVAIGILTIGVLQQLPKALAVSAWSSSVWSEYYARKALVTLESVDDHDFSRFGPIPYSVPELQAELGLV